MGTYPMTTDRKVLGVEIYELFDQHGIYDADKKLTTLATTIAFILQTDVPNEQRRDLLQYFLEQLNTASAMITTKLYGLPEGRPQ
jgi:hypothetical protein